MPDLKVLRIDDAVVGGVAVALKEAQELCELAHAMNGRKITPIFARLMADALLNEHGYCPDFGTVRRLGDIVFTNLPLEIRRQDEQEAAA